MLNWGWNLWIGSAVVNGHGRIATVEKPAGSPDQTDSVKILNFIGSVKYEQAYAMLEEFGKIDSFWMTKLKKVAFVMVSCLMILKLQYRSADSAMRAVRHLDKLKWPEDIGKRLDTTLLTRRVAEMGQRQYEEQERELGGPKVPFEKIKGKLEREKQLRFQAQRALDLNAKLINQQRAAEQQSKESRPPSVSSRHSDRPLDYNRRPQTAAASTSLIETPIGTFLLY